MLMAFLSFPSFNNGTATDDHRVKAMEDQEYDNFSERSYTFGIQSSQAEPTTGCVKPTASSDRWDEVQEHLDQSEQSNRRIGVTTYM